MSGMLEKVFSLTCDNATTNDVMVQVMVRDLNRSNVFSFFAKFFYVRCVAYILNLIVEVGFKFFDKTVLKLREVVTYISFSNPRLERFEESTLTPFFPGFHCLVMFVRVGILLILYYVDVWRLLIGLFYLIMFRCVLNR